MSILTRAAVYTVRIATVTAAAPVLAGAAAASVTAELAGWELRQLASSPLSAEARRLRAEFRELADVGVKAPDGGGLTLGTAASDTAPIVRPRSGKPVLSLLP